jgi:hypothetical protein
MPDEPVACAELEREADGPVQDAAQARVEDALHQDVHRLPRTGEPRFQGHEPGLHEEDQEGGDQHPDGVDRAHDVVGLVDHLGQRGRPRRRIQEPREALDDAEEGGDPEHLAAEDRQDKPTCVALLQSSQSGSNHEATR